jgi:hypothetical protein
MSFPIHIVAEIREYLFVEGASLQQIANKTGIFEEDIATCLRDQVLDASRASSPRELKIYQSIVMSGLSPSTVARRMKTGEEDIRSVLLCLERPSEDKDEEDEEDDESDAESFTMSSTTEETEDESVEESVQDYVNIYLTHPVKDAEDVIHITKDRDDNTYCVLYTYERNKEKGVSGTESRKYFYSTSSLLDYLDQMFKMMMHDTNPYEAIEFHIPNYPSVSYKTKHLKKQSHRILRAVESAFD